jgi:hypothetical protein
MSKSLKLVIVVIIAILTVSLGRIIFQYTTTLPCQYSVFVGLDGRFHWLFQDSIVKDLHKFYSVGNDKGAIYAYNYKNDYRIVIWELSDYNLFELNKIEFHKEVDMHEANFSPLATGAIENGPELTIESRLCLSFNGNITINIEEGSEILKEIKSDEYRGIYGKFRKIGIIDESNEYQMIFKYGGFLSIPTELILYEARNSFFIIVINPLEKGKIDDKTIGLLKL